MSLISAASGLQIAKHGAKYIETITTSDPYIDRTPKAWDWSQGWVHTTSCSQILKKVKGIQYDKGRVIQ
jgi:hypothetical protein